MKRKLAFNLNLVSELAPLHRDARHPLLPPKEPYRATGAIGRGKAVQVEHIMLTLG